MTEEPDESDLDDEVEPPIDLAELDVESWHPRLAWIPPLSLIWWVVAVPVASWIVRSLVLDRAVREDPGQVWLIEVWSMVIGTTVAAGLVLAFAVPIATRVARRRDRWVLFLLHRGFQAGAVAAMVVVALQTVLVVAITIGLIYVVTGATSSALSGLIIVGGLAVIAAFGATALTSLLDRPQPELAIQVDRVDAPALHDAVMDLAERVGVDPPTAILLGPSMSWWTAMGRVQALDGAVSGRVVHVSLPQLAILSEAQVHGILAHELAHQIGGALDEGARLGQGFDRASRSLHALRSESEGFTRVPAKLAVAWLSFAIESIAIVIGERRRQSEAVADQVAAETAGAEAIGAGLILGHAVDRFEDEWTTRVQRTMDGELSDPIRGFRAVVRRGLAGVTADDVARDALFAVGPEHPAMITRLVALGHASDLTERPVTLPERPYLRDAVADASALTRRLILALRPPDRREVQAVFNEPRITAAIVGWLVVGVVFGVILTYRLVEGGASGDAPLIAALLTSLWLAFPMFYPWLERQAVVDRGGFRLRSWWACWLDPEATRFPWSQMRWSDTMALSVDAEARMTLTDGTDRLRWWGTFWPKAERQALYEALRERGVDLAWQADIGETDPERHAVVYVMPAGFVIPELRIAPDGGLVEIRRIKALPMSQLKLGFALIDRLHDPVPALSPKDTISTVDDLAGSARLTVEEFSAIATRVAIDGSAKTWVLRADGEVVWTGSRDDVNKSDLDEVLWVLLPFDKGRGSLVRVAAGDEDEGVDVDDDIEDESIAPERTTT